MESTKIIEIVDAGMEFILYGYGRIRTPLKGIRFTSEQIHNIINMHRGPRNVFAVSPYDNTVRVLMTNDTYNKTEDELFAPKKEEVPAPVEIKVEETVKVEEPIAIAETEAEDDFTVDTIKEEVPEETEDAKEELSEAETTEETAVPNANAQQERKNYNNNNNRKPYYNKNKHH